MKIIFKDEKDNKQFTELLIEVAAKKTYKEKVLIGDCTGNRQEDAKILFARKLLSLITLIGE